MNKLSQLEEKELLDFIKVWLKTHGFTQKDLANELNIKSGRTSEIIKKFKEFYKAETYHQDYYEKNFIRYLMYKKGCQREETLNKIWG